MPDDLFIVPDESTPAEVRSAFLKRLEQADFQPSEAWCASYCTLALLPATAVMCVHRYIIQRGSSSANAAT